MSPPKPCWATCVELEVSSATDKCSEEWLLTDEPADHVDRTAREGQECAQVIPPEVDGGAVSGEQPQDHRQRGEAEQRCQVEDGPRGRRLLDSTLRVGKVLRGCVLPSWSAARDIHTMPNAPPPLPPYLPRAVVPAHLPIASSVVHSSSTQAATSAFSCASEQMQLTSAREHVELGSAPTRQLACGRSTSQHLGAGRARNGRALGTDDLRRRWAARRLFGVRPWTDMERRTVCPASETRPLSSSTPSSSILPRRFRYRQEVDVE